MGRSNGRRPSGGNPGRRGPVRGPKFKGIRFVLGIVNFLMAAVLVVHSLIIGLIKNGAGLGAAGLLPAVLMIVAGILVLKNQHRVAPVAFILPALVDFLADITCFIHAGKAWRMYGFIAMILAIIFLVLCCLRMGRNIFAPAVIMGFIVVVSLLLMLIVGLSAKKKNKDAGSSEEMTENTENAEEPAESAPAEGDTAAEPEEDPLADVTVVQEAQPTDGSLYLTTEAFTINYTGYEVGTDINEDMCVYIYYDFTNNSDVPKTVPSVSYIKVMQNGAECNKASLEESNEQMENYKNEINPGSTVNICQVFTIADLSPIEVSAVEFVPTDARSAVMTLTLSE